MSSSRRLMGLGVAGALALTACDGSPESDYGKIPIEQNYSADAPAAGADSTDRSPFDPLDFPSLYSLPDLNAGEGPGLSGEQCAALALADFSLGEYGNPAYELYEMKYSDGSTSLEVEEFTSSIVMHGLARSIFEVLDVDGNGIIEFYGPEHKDSVLAAKSAATTIEIAARSIGDIGTLSPQELLEIDESEDSLYTIGVLDRAREATEAALFGCVHLRPELHNKQLKP